MERYKKSELEVWRVEESAVRLERARVESKFRRDLEVSVEGVGIE